MVIDKNYKFIFIELPQTATTAISKELQESYGSKTILKKHSIYNEFLHFATPEEKKYKAIGSLRNPADLTVSMYFKYKNDAKLGNPYSTGKNIHKYGTWLRQVLARDKHKKRAAFIAENNASFEIFFMRYYKWPYSNWGSLDHEKFDYIIRFENLADDFKKTFTALGVPLVRDLPQANKTPEKSKDFWSYYESDAAKKRAKYVFKPYMKRWNYTFPESWDYIKEPWYTELLFTLLNIPRKIYWRYFMSRPKKRNW